MMSNLDKIEHRPCDCVPDLGPVHCHACSSITLKEEPYPGPHCGTNAVEEEGISNEAS